MKCHDSPSGGNCVVRLVVAVRNSLEKFSLLLANGDSMLQNVITVNAYFSNLLLLCMR